MAWVLAVILAVVMGGSTASAERRRSSGGSVYVAPSVTRNGTYRQGHYRTSPNTSRLDNWSTQGNSNPYTGRKGSRRAW